MPRKGIDRGIDRAFKDTRMPDRDTIAECVEIAIDMLVEPET